MSNRAAVVRGTFLQPSTSKNRRVYTESNIRSAVSRMQAQLMNKGGLPLTMATGHNAANADDALSTVGRITKVGILPDGRATFEADIADTVAGRDIAKLIDPTNPFIKGISIRGAWVSDPYTITAEDGDEAVTADDLEIKGIDFTWRPGVAGAQIESVDWVTEAAKADPCLIFESVEDAQMFTDNIEETAMSSDMDQDVDITRMLWDAYILVRKIMMAQSMDMDDISDAEVWSHLEDLKGALKNAIVDQVGDMAMEGKEGQESENSKNLSILEDNKRIIARFTEAETLANKTPYGNVIYPYGNVIYADPGYQKDGKKRYPIDTEKHVRAAWSYINESDNASQYSANQLKRIKSKIKSAAKKFGINIVSETDMLIKELSEVLEAYVSTTICTDDGNVTVSATSEDDDNVSELASRLAYSAILAITALDDDEAETSEGTEFSGVSLTPDDNMEAGYGEPCVHCNEEVEDTAMYCPSCGHMIANTEEPVMIPTPTTNTQEAEMADQTTEATEAEITEAIAEAQPVTETAIEAAPRNLTDADAAAIASAFASAIAPMLAPAVKESAPAVAEAPVTEAVAAVAEPVDEPVVESAKTFTLDEVKAFAADAAKEAYEAASQAAVEQFRSGGAGRKGLVDPTQSAGVIEADDELDAYKLASMGNDEFYRTIAPVWESQDFNFTKFGITQTA